MPVLSHEPPRVPVLETLDQALNKGTVRVKETSEAGEVPFLSIQNMIDVPILILDGEEVTGGKQDRIVNASIIIPSNTVIKVPVSCVESGRWHYQQRDFQSGNSIFRAKSRAVQKESVTASLRQHGTYYSDQRAVWREVGEILNDLGVSSNTCNFKPHGNTSPMELKSSWPQCALQTIKLERYSLMDMVSTALKCLPLPCCSDLHSRRSFDPSPSMPLHQPI